MNNDLPTDHLRHEYEAQSSLFSAQPPIVQRFLEAQGQQIALAYINRIFTVRFSLPDRVILIGNPNPLPVPKEVRDQHIGGFRDRLIRHDVHETLRQRLAQLEQYNDQAVVTSAQLIRYTTAYHMTHNMLPAGRKIQYHLPEDSDIPNIPEIKIQEPESAITAETDAIAEGEIKESGRGELQVPYVPAARRFYLPQWVAFDDKGSMLVKSTEEAEAHIASMQRFLDVLFAARSLAPYMIVDAEFEAKRYGMLGQLVNQGRSLALHMNAEIIQLIKDRANSQSLNRGLSLQLPYFDDQDLRIETHDFVVIPAGRIMFIPAFVVRAAFDEQAKVAQDTRFSSSTRKHLMSELQMLGEAFDYGS
jgi:hypothetical protein